MTGTDATLLGPAVGPAPEADIVRDLLRRGAPAVPVCVAIAAVVAGTHGALSALTAAVLVVANFAAAALSLGWAARISLALLMGVALAGYLVRLGMLFLAVLLLRDLSWVHLPSLGLTLVVLHLGLLAWETRYVSATLAHPALKPVRKESAA